MKRKHTSKAKYLGIGLASLAAVSVFSIGFASWVIGHTGISVTESIEVDVSDVKEETLNVTEGTHDLKVNFGPATVAEGSSAGGLITSTGQNEEDLEAKIVLNITSANRTMARDIVFTPTYSNNWLTAIKNNYITAPMTTVSGKTVTATATTVATLAQNGAATAKTDISGLEVEFAKTSDTSGNTAGNATEFKYTLTVTMTFGWGSAFGNKNPIYTSSWDSSNAHLAIQAALKSLYQGSDGTTSNPLGSITLKVTSKAAAS